MADYKVTDTELTSIANAIRTKGGTQAQLEFPTGFVSAVQAIPTGGGNIQPLSVTQDGTYNPPSGVDGYAPVTVNVSGGSLYNYLDEYNADWNYSGDYIDASMYISDRIMRVTAMSATSTFCTSQPFNFTGKTRLKIKLFDLSGSYESMCRIVVDKSPINNTNRGTIYTVFDNGVGEYYLNLPEEKTSLYVGVMAWTASSFVVDEIVAE